jgi:hypothetical protein
VKHDLLDNKRIVGLIRPAISGGFRKQIRMLNGADPISGSALFLRNIKALRQDPADWLQTEGMQERRSQRRLRSLRTDTAGDQHQHPVEIAADTGGANKLIKQKPSSLSWTPEC